MTPGDMTTIDTAQYITGSHAPQACEKMNHLKVVNPFVVKTLFK